MTAIFKKEFRSWFLSPMGYIILLVFGLLSTVMFMMQVTTDDLTGYFNGLTMFVAFIIAILCMRLFSEERKTKTEQLLLTAPVNLFEIVLGKFLAAFSVFCLCLAETLLVVMVVGFAGAPDWGVIFTSYLGYLLLGAALIAIGTFFSSITQNQIVAAIVTFLTFVGLMLSSSIISIIIGMFTTMSAFAKTIFTAIIYVIPVFERYYEFAYGVVNISTVFYYLSVTAVFLFLTTRVLEKRRWS